MRHRSLSILPLAPWLSILLLALASVWCSDQLLAAHDSGITGRNHLLFRFCGDDASNSPCAEVARSTWSTVRLPVVDQSAPVALLGWSYFAFIAIWFALNGSARSAFGIRRWIPLLTATGGAYATLFFVSLMIFGRVPWCPACLVVHTLNVLLIAAIIADAFPRTAPPRPSDPDGSASGNESPAVVFAIASRWRSPVLAVLITAVLLFLLNRGRAETATARAAAADLQPYRVMVDSARQNASVLMAAYRAEPPVVIPPPIGDLSPSGAHRLVVFTDMQCPACAANAIVLHDLIRPMFGPRLRVEIRHDPLCRDCNPFIKQTVHPDACQAAYAAEAVRQMAGPADYLEMTESLHLHRDELSVPLYDSLARSLNLPVKAFDAAMAGKSVHDAVAADVALAHRLNVHETPTMFLDGRQVPDICQTALFWETIAAEPTTRTASTTKAATQ